MSGADPPDQTRVLRRQVIEALTYPRHLMRGSIELDRCTHAGHYAVRDAVCQACDHGPECEWLTGHDEHVDLDGKSLAALTEALEISYGYVDARVTVEGHASALCRCSACEWLREAERLLERLR
jgi:hypothetical protein